MLLITMRFFLLALLFVVPDTSPKNRDARRLGHIWIVDQTTGKVIQVDRAKGVLREISGFSRPRDVAVLPDGNILVGGLDRKVVEVDRKDRRVWTYTARKAVYSVRLLPNGNRLIAESRALTEVNAEGNIVWELPLGGTPEDIEVLRDGTYLIAQYGGSRILRVNRKKETLMSFKTNSAPMTAQMLPNGNILVAEVSGRRVVEYDRDGNEVATIATGTNTPSGYRTKRGTTIISTWKRVYEVDKDGNEVWKGPNVKFVVRAREY